MRFFIICLSILILSFSFSNTYGQAGLRKANKLHELSAFNLAIKSYLNVLSSHPRNPEVIGRLADCYRHLNRMEEAERTYARLMELPDVDEIYYLQYGKVLKTLGRYEEAKLWFLKYAEKYPVTGNQFAESCNFAKARINDVPVYQITNEFANTASADFGPALFKEGKIVYSSGRRDIHKSDRGAPKSEGVIHNQLYITYRDGNGFLRKPALLRHSLGKTSNEGPVAYSPDGKMIAVTKNNFVDGTRFIPSSGLELSLHIGDVTSKGDWTNLVPFPYNGSGYSTGFATFSPDGNALYFASDRPDGFGGFDIYVSYKVGNSWSAPENVGGMVNSLGNEITPFFDGTGMYFASDWHFGFGGFDIFRSMEMPTGGWNPVQNMGTGINSPRDDLGYVFDRENNFGYLVSNRLGGRGFEDLYRITGGVSANNIVIRVYNSSTREAIEGASVDLSDCGGPNEALSNAHGVIAFYMGAGNSCQPQIRKSGFADQKIFINTTVESSRDYDVFLSVAGEMYRGQVFSARSNIRMSDVIIRATNTVTNQRLEAYSDKNGQYALGLESNSTYIVRYSKVGYKDVNRTVRTGNPQNSKRMETIYLPPAGTNINEPALSNVSNGANPTKPPRTNEASGGQDADSYFRDGYAVQIAALSSRAVDLGQFEGKIGDSGNIYLHRERGKSKVRVGIFATREEAKQAQSVLKRQGFAGAFLVYQNTAGHEDKIISETGNAFGRPSGTGSPNSLISNPSKFMVRLGAYKNPKFFDREKVIEIGIIDSYRKGDFTIMLLTGYESKSMAERALRKAKAKGFKGAYIVTDQNGNFVKVR